MASRVTKEWSDLNRKLRGSGESDCMKLLRAEQDGPHRKTYILRIHSRLTRVRRARERKALAQ